MELLRYNENSIKNGIKEINNINLTFALDEEIHKILLHDIQILPFIIVEILPGLIIARGRINKEYLFRSESDITYNNDLKKINLGRCNYPGQSIFYGTIKSDYMYHEEIGILTELFESKSIKKQKSPYYFTVGYWEIVKPIKVYKLPIGKLSTINIPNLLKDHDNLLEQLYEKYPTVSKDLINVLYNFTTEKFNEIITNGHENKYKITAAIFNLLANTDDSNIKAMIYPSIKAEFKINNIAIMPNIVDTHMKLKDVLMFEISKHSNDFHVTPIKRVINLSQSISEFDWSDYKNNY